MSESRYYICDQRVSKLGMLYTRLTEAENTALVMYALHHQIHAEDMIGPAHSYVLAHRSEEYNEVFRLGVDVPEEVQAKWRQRGWMITPLPQHIMMTSEAFYLAALRAVGYEGSNDG